MKTGIIFKLRYFKFTQEIIKDAKGESLTTVLGLWLNSRGLPVCIFTKYKAMFYIWVLPI